MSSKLFSILVLLVLVGSCQNTTQTPKQPVKPTVVKPPPKPQPKRQPLDTLAGFTNIKAIAPTVVLDIRYATKNNFVGEQIYDCGACYLRPKVAQALAAVNKKLRNRGIGIKVFDCYRPLPAQQRLWDKVPNPSYVTPPSKGSMHNRGMAIDLTIYDISKMRELYMGSPYDFFGPKAHIDYALMTPKVRANREILQKTMYEAGFRSIRTEWWHFYFAGPWEPLSSLEWNCEKK